MNFLAYIETIGNLPPSLYRSSTDLANYPCFLHDQRDNQQKQMQDDYMRQESEDQLQAIFEQAAVGIASSSLDGRWLRVNQKLCDIVGYTSDELLEKTFQDITYPDDLDADLSQLHRVLAGEIKSYSMEKRYIRKDQSLVWVNLNVSVVRDAQGDPKHMIAVIEDISDRKQLERNLAASEEKFRALIEFAPDPLILIDDTGRIVLANSRVESVFGYQPQEIIGQFVELLLPHQIQDNHKILRPHYLDGNVLHSMAESLDLGVRHKNGSEIPVSISLSPIKAGGENLVMAYIVDISVQKQIEERLRASLAKEKELNDLKARFISITSHEFRTPLAIIQSSINILKNYHDRMDQKQTEQHLDRFQTQVDQMVAILNDMLTINQEEAAADAFAPVMLDLEQFCRQLAGKFQDGPHKNHKLIYSFSGQPKKVSIDETLLYRAISNLLTNAFKYSPEGSPVFFDLLFEQSRARIRIKDSGIGIPATDQPHLFKAFHRAKNVSTIMGMGLGLEIVKRAIKAHGGSITFESQEGAGTEFIIDIPIQQVGEVAQPSSTADFSHPSSPPSPAPPHI